MRESLRSANESDVLGRMGLSNLLTVRESSHYLMIFKCSRVWRESVQIRQTWSILGDGHGAPWSFFRDSQINQH